MQANQMVATQDQRVPPPEPTVPEPVQSSRWEPNTVEEGELAETISEVKHIAERVGGLDRLKRIVDMLASIKE